MAVIDIGAAAIDRTGSFPVGYTTFGLDNPANATGTIDTIEVWMETNTTATHVGTFFLISGTTYQCRGSHLIGAVTAGSKQTFSGLSIAVTLGDYLGCDAVIIERDTTGFAGIYYVSGEYIDPGDQASYALIAGDAISLYGTGTEAGGATYELSCSDGLKVGETLATQCNFGVSVTHGLKGGDVSGSTGIFSKLASDGIKLGDTLSTTAILNALTTDGIKLGDLPIATAIFNASASDGVKLGDSALTNLILGLLATDGITLSDLATIGGQIYEMLLADGLKLGDTVTVGKVFDLLVSDGFTLGDALAIAIFYYTMPKTGRYGVSPSDAFGASIAKANRYGVTPTVTWGTAVSTGGRYG